MSEKIEPLEYGLKYYDSLYEYRQVTFSKELGNHIKKLGLISEKDWSFLGISMSKGWVHYDCHPPEPYIMLFRRPLSREIELNQETLNELRVRRFYENWNV